MDPTAIRPPSRITPLREEPFPQSEIPEGLTQHKVTAAVPSLPGKPPTTTTLYVCAENKRAAIGAVRNGIKVTAVVVGDLARAKAAVANLTEADKAALRKQLEGS
jgi:hypothetical protein